MAKMPQTQESATTQTVDLTSVLARLDSLEAENQKLKAQVNPENKFSKAKEKYQWPWNYSYKLWGDVPVLSYKSIKKDKTKDFTYKNHLWVLINNHFLDLKLADDSSIEVDVNEFNLNCQKSEKLPAEPISDGVTITGYKFNIHPYGECIVSSSLIN
jgi:hypothetical protein